MQTTIIVIGRMHETIMCKRFFFSISVDLNGDHLCRLVAYDKGTDTIILCHRDEYANELTHLHITLRRVNVTAHVPHDKYASSAAVLSARTVWANNMYK